MVERHWVLAGSTGECSGQVAASAAVVLEQAAAAWDCYRPGLPVARWWRVSAARLRAGGVPPVNVPGGEPGV